MVAFRLDRQFDFPLPPAELWERLTNVEEYRRWWPWLRRVEGDGFVEGGITRIAVAAPVPWVLRLDLNVTELRVGESVKVEVSGDLTGSATLKVSAVDGGSQVRMQWSVAPSSPPLRLAARMTYPLVVFGQNWVVSAGLRQFRASLGSQPGR